VLVAVAAQSTDSVGASAAGGGFGLGALIAAEPCPQASPRCPSPSELRLLVVTPASYALGFAGLGS
jgi:hypothetical protein